jgi:hypothetical protein
MEPQPNSTASATGSLPVRRRFPRASRSALSNDPAFLAKQPLSPRAQDRRRRDLITAFLAALGPAGVTDLTQVMVRRAAELTTAVEMARADMLNGVPTDMLALVRLEGVAARAVRVLGVRVEPVKAPKGRGELARLRRRARGLADTEESHGTQAD